LQRPGSTPGTNLANNPGPNSKFVVLDYGDNGQLEAYLKLMMQPYIDSGKLIVYRHDAPGHFRMSHAKNMAHRCALLEDADVIVNMDADNYTPIPGFADYVLDNIGYDPNLFMYCNAKSVVGRARQGLAGRIAVHRNTFLKAGGYDESYIVWAPEDEDFKARIRRMGCGGVLIDNKYLFVIHHKDGLRFKEYPHAKPTAEEEAVSIKRIRDADHIIANFGNFGVGYVYRNFTDQRTYLAPLPTRIFGVGMQKTGTTSLHEAFKIFGFDSAHWTGPWWAKQVYEDVIVTGHSLLIDQVYAMSDFPFTILFRELDKNYPGSKFILTVRDEKKWIQSMKNHWEINSKRFDWDHDCFTHRLHNIVYGRKSFDADTMINRYRQHNHEVIEYFRDRHRLDDLLVLDIDNATWGPICQFLGVNIPTVPFPHAFASLITTEKETTITTMMPAPPIEPDPYKESTTITTQPKKKRSVTRTIIYAISSLILLLIWLDLIWKQWGK